MHFYIGARFICGLSIFLIYELTDPNFLEVEQTGASSQFYDKFSMWNFSCFVFSHIYHHLFFLDARLVIGFSNMLVFILIISDGRRNISYILKVVWDNPTHREALNIEAR